jgi:hypothetical protein
MNYATIQEKKLPIGSGAMESAIRRVVNPRLKGPSLSVVRPTLKPCCDSGLSANQAAGTSSNPCLSRLLMPFIYDHIFGIAPQSVGHGDAFR